MKYIDYVILIIGVVLIHASISLDGDFANILRPFGIFAVYSAGYIARRAS